MRTARALLTLCLGLCLGAVPGTDAWAAPEARQGTLDLRNHDRNEPVVDIRGEWGFAWQRFIPAARQPSAAMPASPAASQPAAFATVPGDWNALTADGKPPGPDGYGSFTLDVLCAPGDTLALAVPAQRTALRLYINDELVARQGVPGVSAGTALPAIGGRAVLTDDYPCPMRVTMHLSNYSHRAGGFVRALSIGPRDALAARHEARLVRDTALMGAYLVLGLIPIIFFAARRKDVTPLLFGLFCLTQALYADMIGERLLLQPFGREVGWETYLRIEYLAWFATIGLFLLLVNQLFRGALHRRLAVALLACCAAGVLAVLVTPARIYSHLAPFGQALTVVISLCVTWAVARAAWRGRPGAAVLLGGMAFLLLLVVIDVLQYNTGGTTRSVTPFGLMVFVLSPAVVLARRLARALNAEELRTIEQREKADLLVRTTKAGIYDWDAPRNLVTYSPRLKEMLGYPGDADTAGWPVFYDFVHPDDREAVRMRTMAALRGTRDPDGGGVTSGEVRHEPTEYRLRRTDGRDTWVLAEAISLTGSDGRTLRYICSFLDITERRAMEEGLKASRDQVAAQAAQLRAQNTELEYTGRLREEVERISRHDLKTPLNSIVGVAQLLREDARLTPDQRELVDITERAGYRILEMINLSLDLFKMESGRYDFRPQAVDLREVAARAMVDLHVLAEASGVALRQAGAPGASGEPVYARAEALLCYSIVANLLKNAIEATPAGGTVTIGLHAGDPVRLTLHNPGKLPEGLEQTFFDKYTTAGKSGGTGLGTYSARLMARVQEGDLTLATGTSTGTGTGTGQGSGAGAAGGITLTLTLRALGAEALRPAPAPALAAVAALPGRAPGSTAPAAAFSPRQVLVVDDDEYNRLILRRYLPTPPFTVDTAPNGQAALECARRQWPDIVLIDLEMPVMNGPDTVAHLRARQKADGLAPCIIVMLSSNDDAASIQRGLDAGIDRYLTKPVTREALMGVLQALDPDLRMPDTTVQVDPDLAGGIDAFLQSRRELADAMAQAVDRGEREQLRSLAHRAGGALALYGFDWAAEQSRRIEHSAAHAPPPELAAAVALLREHLRTVRVASPPMQ